MTTTESANNFRTSLSAKTDRHLWDHFSRHGHGITPPIITRGEKHITSTTPARKYFDALSGVVRRAGRTAAGLAEAAAKQAETLAFFPLWSYATPSAIEPGRTTFSTYARAT